MEGFLKPGGAGCSMRFIRYWRISCNMHEVGAAGLKQVQLKMIGNHFGSRLRAGVLGNSASGPSPREDIPALRV